MPASTQTTGPVVYVGTYTTQGARNSEGIYVYRLDMATGALKLESTVHTENPSYLALDPRRRFLYAANESGQIDGHPGGGVSAFAVDAASAGATARLTALNRQPSLGSAPCYVSVDATGRYAFAANYGQGNVVMLPIQPDGSLAPASDMVQHQGSSLNPQRQKEPHAHSIVLDPTNTYAFAQDLGIDKLMISRLDLAHGKLVPHGEVDAQPGSGPRHLTFHPNGKYAYLIQELGFLITAFAYDAAAGTLAMLQSVPTLPDDYHGFNLCADVHVSPSGKFVYGSNRGHDSIVIYAIDEATGRMTFVARQSCGGKTPRGFAIDPTGAYLLAANQESDNIVTFRLDPATGKLLDTGQVTSVPLPVCAKIVNFA